MLLPILSLQKLIIGLPTLSSSVIYINTSSCYNMQTNTAQINTTQGSAPYNMLSHARKHYLPSELTNCLQNHQASHRIELCICCYFLPTYAPRTYTAQGFIFFSLCLLSLDKPMCMCVFLGVLVCRSTIMISVPEKTSNFWHGTIPKGPRTKIPVIQFTEWNYTNQKPDTELNLSFFFYNFRQKHKDNILLYRLEGKPDSKLNPMKIKYPWLRYEKQINFKNCTNYVPMIRFKWVFSLSNLFSDKRKLLIQHSTPRTLQQMN